MLAGQVGLSPRLLRQLRQAGRSACQFQGSSRSSLWVLVRPETIRSSTSDNHVQGPTPFSFDRTCERNGQLS
jgi:hypothetical protein